MILKQTFCTNAFFIDFEITIQNKTKQIFIHLTPGPYLLLFFFFFFLLISIIKILLKTHSPVHRICTKRQKHQETKLQWSSNAGREIQEKDGKTRHHSRRVKRMKDLSSIMTSNPIAHLQSWLHRHWTRDININSSNRATQVPTQIHFFQVTSSH